MQDFFVKRIGGDRGDYRYRFSNQWSVVSGQGAFDCSGICAYAFFSEEGGR